MITYILKTKGLFGYLVQLVKCVHVNYRNGNPIIRATYAVRILDENNEVTTAGSYALSWKSDAERIYKAWTKMTKAQVILEVNKSSRFVGK